MRLLFTCGLFDVEIRTRQEWAQQVEEEATVDAEPAVAGPVLHAGGTPHLGLADPTRIGFTAPLHSDEQYEPWE